MEFRRMRPRKKPNQRRAMLLIMLLLLVILIWLNADRWMEWLFGN